MIFISSSEDHEHPKSYKKSHRISGEDAVDPYESVIQIDNNSFPEDDQEVSCIAN